MSNQVSYLARVFDDGMTFCLQIVAGIMFIALRILSIPFVLLAEVCSLWNVFYSNTERELRKVYFTRWSQLIRNLNSR